MSAMIARRFALVVATAMAPACGGRVTDAIGDDGGGGGGNGDGGGLGDGGGRGDGGGTDRCPASQPGDGVACTKNGLECEYAGIAEFCGHMVSCVGGEFLDSTGMCNLGNNLCPATRAQVKIGDACTTKVLCDYADGRCGCVPPIGPAQPDAWYCTTAPAGCPAQHPFLGTACTMEGQTCDYGACLFGNLGPYDSPLIERCTGGIWVRATAICPK